MRCSPPAAAEQVRTVCLSKTNIKVMGSHAGVSVGPDGATHQAIEDIAITRCIPGLTVIYPCDSIEARKATIESGQSRRPGLYPSGARKNPGDDRDHTPFAIGAAQVVRDGTDAAIIACGPLLYQSLWRRKNWRKTGPVPRDQQPYDQTDGRKNHSRGRK